MEVPFSHQVLLDNGPPHPLEAGGCLGGWSIPVLWTHHQWTKRTIAEALCLPFEQTWDAGGEESLILRWVSWLGLFFVNSTLHLTPWLSSTMCSSDSCSSEILGLGKHVCYADSRTTNFTRLTSPLSVRLRTAARTYFLNFCVIISIPMWLHGLSVDVFCASPSLKLWPLRFQVKWHQLDLINKLKSVFWFNWSKDVHVE